MPPDEDESDANEEVLTPEELDITDDDRVAEIEEGRYVISSDASSPSVSDPDTEDDVPADGSPEPTALTDEAVRGWLCETVGSADARYGFDVTAKFGDSVERQELFSNDVVTTFENLLVWYAQHVGGDTPVEEALGILLMESNVPVRYPAATVHGLVSACGLDRGSSIGDLLDTLDDADGVRFPPAGFQRADE